MLQEVLRVLLAELVVIALILVRVLLVQTAQEVLLVTLILRSGKSELSSTAAFYHQGLQSFLCLTFLGQGIHLKGILRPRKDIAAISGATLQERAVGLLLQLLQTVVEHTDGCILHEVDEQILDVTLDFIGNGVRLYIHLHNAILHLLILVNDNDGLGIVGHSLSHDGSRILWHLDGREEFLDFLLHLVHVEVTYYDDSLVVGTIPLLVVVAQHLRLEVVDNLHQTDGHAVTILRARIQLGQVALKHSHHGTGTQTPLLMNHTTLLLNLLGLQQQAISPVVQDEQT